MEASYLLTHNFQYDNYDIIMKVESENKLSITVVDCQQRAEYHLSQCVLENIGVSTLIKSFERSNTETTAVFSIIGSQQNQLLEIKVQVDSIFLKPIVEKVMLKRIREVTNDQVVKKKLSRIERIIKEYKNQQDRSQNKTYCSVNQLQKNYCSAGYESVASINLPSGQYLLTLNVLIKQGPSKMFCFYFNQATPLNASGVYSLSSSDHFSAHTLRVVHTVTSQTQNVKFSVMGTNTYPVTIRNAILQAKLIVNHGENQGQLISDTHKTILTARKSTAIKVPRVALAPRRKY